MSAVPVKSVFLFAFMLIVCISCTKKQPDDSLTVEEYMKIGVPDPNKEWSMTDFTQAHSALAKIKWEKPFQLPRKDSEKSKLLFDHMLSFDNMSFLQNSALSLNEKAEQISSFIRVCDYWGDIYSNPVIDNYYHRELIAIQIFNLGVSERMLHLAQEINKSDDPTAVTLRYGYNSIKANFVNNLANDLKTQRRATQYLKKDLETMADTIYASVIRNKESMDSASVNDLKQSLRVVIDSTTSDYIRNKYTSLEKAL